MKRRIELANLVIRYGEKKLLDMLEDVIWPLFKNAKVKGEGEVEEYRFLNPQIDFIGKSKTPIIFGQFIKIQNIEAVQKLNAKKTRIVPSSEEIQAAPSSFFVINLENHRIAFLGEVKRNPTLKNLEYCIKKLLSDEWRLRWEGEKQRILKEKDLKKLPHKGEVREEILKEAYKIAPRPEIRITPLPSLTDVNKHLDNYDKFTRLVISPLKTNDEYPDENEQFLRAYVKQKENLDASSGHVEIKNGKKGLNDEKTKELINSAANSNFVVKIEGKDEDNDVLKGDLENLSVQIKEEIPAYTSSKERANFIFEKMKSILDKGIAKAPQVSQTIKEKAKKIATKISKS